MQFFLGSTFAEHILFYMIFQVDDSGNGDFKSSNEEIYAKILTG